MNLDNMINEQLSNMDLGQLHDLLGAASQQGQIFSGMSLGEMIHNILTGRQVFDFHQIMDAILTYFLRDVTASIFLAVQVVALCIAMGLLKNLSSSFGEDTVASLGTIVCSCTVIVLCLSNFIQVYAMCRQSMSLMTTAMQVLLPLMIPLLIAMGGLSSGGVLNPVIMGAITIFTTVIKTFILPAIFLSCVFLLVNSLTDKDYVKKLAMFLRNFSVFAMGLSVTVFSGLTAVQGIITRTADGMIAKTARFSVDNFVPIVGGFAADSIDLIISCTGIIKNGVGILGLLVILTLLILPLLKIAAIALVYKITSMIIEPIGNRTVSDCMNEVGNTVITLAVVLFLCAVMFLIFLTILISIGSAGILK